MSEVDWNAFGPLHYLPPKRIGRSRLARAQRASDWQPANVFDVAARDGWTCAYCGCAVEVKDGAERDSPDVRPATLDHVVPTARGGGNTVYNAVLACPSCNSRKGKRHPALMFG